MIMVGPQLHCNSQFLQLSRERPDESAAAFFKALRDPA